MPAHTPSFIPHMTAGRGCMAPAALLLAGFIGRAVAPRALGRVHVKER